MTTAVQRRRGTSTEHATFTGLDGEITVNTTTYTAHIHDGATVGGVPLAKADGSNIVTSSIDINGGTIDGTVIGGTTPAAVTTTALVATTADINAGTIDGTVIGGSSAAAGTFTTFTSTGIDDNATSTAITIDASENVGIGTSSPSSALTVEGDGTFKNTTDATGSFVKIADNADRSIIITSPISAGSAAGRIATDGTANSLEVGVRDYPTAITISGASGNVGIGTSSPAEKLQINDGRLRFLESGQRQYNIGVASGTPDFQIYDATFSYAPFTLDGSGNVGIGTTSPNSYASSRLHLNGSSTSIALRLTNTTTGTTVDDGSDIEVSGSDLNIINRESSNTKFFTGNTERMRIDQNGTLLLTTPSGGAYGYLNVKEAGGGDVRFGMQSGINYDAIAGTWSNNGMKFYTFGSERLRITSSGACEWRPDGTTQAMTLDASGNLLVGGTDTNPAGNNVDGIALNSSGRISAQVSGDHHRLGRAQDGTIVAFHSAGGAEGSISISGSTTSYNTSSDERLKENITDANDAGDKIDAIKVRQYDWKVNGSHQDYGMVAQELMTVAPEAVSGDPESDEMMGVDYSKLVPMMLKEIQSLRARVAQLEGAN